MWKLQKISLDTIFVLGILFLILISLTILHSIAPSLFPLYYFYLMVAILAFVFFFKVGFEVVSLFTKHLYILSVFLLILPLLIGQVTRGAVRWIPLGPLSIQPAEIVRPFLLVFFANYLTSGRVTLEKLVKSLMLLALPLFLIIIQPSLGVGIITAAGFVGVFLATDFDKKYFLLALLIFALMIPVGWRLIAPYQKTRIISFLNPMVDPLGTGYNSIQSMISVGSGKVFGRGLGRGVQTQLAFLPERHTDFVFASISEELGLVGGLLTVVALFVLFWRLVDIVDKATSSAAMAFVSGLFLTLFLETVVHIGMNVGILPITGIPLPLVSAGGSSLVATMMGLGIAMGARKSITP